jgi:hypothetical protein
LATSSVLTRNISPAPSASLAVKIGVCTQKNPCSWKYRWIAMLRQWRTRATAPSRVRARTQVRHFAQVLERRFLRLNRIRLGIVHPADHIDRLGLQLDRLTLPLALRQRAGRDHGAAGRQLHHLTLIVRQYRRGHDLNGIEAGAVVDMDE